MRSFLITLFIYLPLLSQEIQTFYGPIEVEEPLLIELIESVPMQRLKKIHPYGDSYYTTHKDEETHMTKEPTPQFLYKILSKVNWVQSQAGTCLILDNTDEAFIHLSRENQLERIRTKYWADRTDFVILKIDTEKLVGDLILEANPGGVNKYYHLHKGSIPLESVVDVRFPSLKSEWSEKIPIALRNSNRLS